MVDTDTTSLSGVDAVVEDTDGAGTDLGDADLRDADKASITAAATGGAWTLTKGWTLRGQRQAEGGRRHEDTDGVAPPGPAS